MTILGHGTYHCLQLGIQRFSEVPDQLGMTILSVIPGNPLLWAFLMQNLNLGIAKMSVIHENPLFPNPVLPKTSVFNIRCMSLTAIPTCLETIAMRI